ncbi:MAG: Hpt domain-containing protein [Burkholderiales bacterium]|nr:Hpt domain-containing protein [Burkholderiales bacterium]
METAHRLAELDRAALETIRSISDGSDDLLRQVVCLFVDSTPALLEDIEAGLKNGEMDRLRMAAHTLKSSAANLGATVLGDMARQLETAARAGILGQGLPSFPSVKEEFEAACRALDALLGEAG